MDLESSIAVEARGQTAELSDKLTLETIAYAFRSDHRRLYTIMPGKFDISTFPLSPDKPRLEVANVTVPILVTPMTDRAQ